MGKSDIKKFYERALEEGRFNSELFKELKTFSTENELKDFLKDKILSIAKEMGYNFSVEELLTYEKEAVHKIKEYQLENINGGVSIKNLALGGVVSLMALGAGIFGTMNSASAMEREGPTNTVEGNGSVEEVGPVIYDDQDLPESFDNESEDNEDLSVPPENQGVQNEAEKKKARLIEDIENELTQLLKELNREFWRSISFMRPRARLMLEKNFNIFYENKNTFIKDFIESNLPTLSEKNIISERKRVVQEIKEEFDKNFRIKIQANMQVNDAIRRVTEIFYANLYNLGNQEGRALAMDRFRRLMHYVEENWLNGFISRINQSANFEEIQIMVSNSEENLYKLFRDEILLNFPNPTSRSVAVLQRSYKHAIRRGDTPQRINRKPRLAQLLERDAAIPLNPIEERELNTPFGKVKVKNPRRDHKGLQNSRVIIIPNSNKAPTYVEIAEHLDRYYREQGPDLTLEMLYTILEYLELPAEDGDNVQNVLERLNARVTNNTKLMPGADNEQRKCVAALCGILMVCESGQNRSENGGKRERGVIKALIKNVNSGLSRTPFADAFGYVDMYGVEYEGYYTPAAKIVRDKKDNRKILKQGGSVRGKVVVGKVLAKKVFPYIPKETLENDIINTEKLLLSQDSWEEYEEGDIFESQSDAFEIQRDIFRIYDRRYLITDNPGPIGGCLWRIFLNNGVAEKDLQIAAENTGIKYNDFVDLEGGLKQLITEINRLGYNLALNVDIFDYSGTYHGLYTTHNEAGANINIALIYDSFDGLGHYVEEF